MQSVYTISQWISAVNLQINPGDGQTKMCDFKIINCWDTNKLSEDLVTVCILVKTNYVIVYSYSMPSFDAVLVLLSQVLVKITNKLFYTWNFKLLFVTFFLLRKNCCVMAVQCLPKSSICLTYNQNCFHLNRITQMIVHMVNFDYSRERIGYESCKMMNKMF